MAKKEPKMEFYKPEERTPAFGIKYVLIAKDDTWTPGWLKEIKTTETEGEVFVWRDSNGDDILDEITHYMPIYSPNKKDFKL